MDSKITIIKNGPAIIQSQENILINGESKGNTVAICRCGHSKNGIFCDGNHKQKQKEVENHNIAYNELNTNK
ncbi:MAG: CDGSH iron-sulfur domain-containing protein [Candidatus Paceibacteria bacterium]